MWIGCVFLISCFAFSNFVMGSPNIFQPSFGPHVKKVCHAYFRSSDYLPLWSSAIRNCDRPPRVLNVEFEVKAKNNVWRQIKQIYPFHYKSPLERGSQPLPSWFAKLNNVRKSLLKVFFINYFFEIFDSSMLVTAIILWQLLTQLKNLFLSLYFIDK